jgi:transposase-like protein
MPSTKNIATSPAGFKRYLDEIRRQAVDLFNSSLAEYKTRQATAKRVASLLSVNCFDTILAWVRQAEIDRGASQCATAGNRTGHTGSTRTPDESARNSGISRNQASNVLRLA